MFRLGSLGILGLAYLLAAPVAARSLDLPLHLSETFLQQRLEQHLAHEPGQRVRVWDDGKQCNQLELADPELALSGERIVTRSQGFAQLGTALAGHCLAVIRWQGIVEVEQQPMLGPEPGQVRFRVTDSRVLSADGESPGVMGTVWGWVKKHLHPRFERLQIDINPVLAEIDQLLPLVYPHQPPAIQRILTGIRLTRVGVDAPHLMLNLQMDLPGAIMTDEPPAEAAPLTPSELDRWQRSWQQWDAFITQLLRQAGQDAVSADIRADLLAVLIEARRDLLPVLTGPTETDHAGDDPAAALFASSWQRLQPVLARLSEQLPPESAWRYIAFMAAADVLATLEAVTEQTGFSLDAAALRRLARLANPELPIDALEYNTEVDAELRRVFGFGPPLTTIPLSSSPGDVSSALRGAFGSSLLMVAPVTVLQDSHYTSLVERLDGWVPSIAVLDKYLPLVQQLLDRVVGVTLNDKELQREYRQLFRPLVLATAWQESCWRQYIRKGGEVIPIRSSVGAVGIMQINQHVWRGFYEVDRLQNDIGYNARAGAEIVHHYLVDYAIARGEHQLPGGRDNLIRATYAMYNGGPGHRDRYRRDNTSASLRAIDRAFWHKYEKVREGDPLAVAECYAG